MKSIVDLMGALKKLDYSQTDVASYLGVREITIYRWETGRAKPQKSIIRDLERLIQEKTK